MNDINLFKYFEKKMSNFFLIIKVLLLVKIQFILAQENEEDKDNRNSKSGNDINLSDFIQANPYLILHIPPWEKYEIIKKKFERLTEKYQNLDRINTLKYEKIYNAFVKIKAEHEKNNFNDKSFYDVLKDTLKNIIYYESIMVIIIISTWIFVKFNSFISYQITVFIAIDNIIPHWFESIIIQYIVSFLLGTLIYGIGFFKKEEPTQGKSKNKFHKVGD